jgi:hypothetical protein
MPAPHALPITVSEADRLTLQSWARARRRRRARDEADHVRVLGPDHERAGREVEFRPMLPLIVRW